MTNTERAAYIRGLVSGLDLDPKDKVVRVLNEVVELLDELALSVSTVEETVADMGEQVDDIDEGLGELEELVYGDEEEDEDDEGDDGFDEDDEFYEVTCPQCKQTVCIDGEIAADGEMDCPNCGARLEFLVDEEDQTPPEEDDQ